MYINRDTDTVKVGTSPGRGNVRAGVAGMVKVIGEFELRVLLAIIRLRGNAYAITIQHELGVHNNKEVCLGAIYVTLDRLEKRGFIASYEGEATKVRGGGPRRMVKLTPEGICALESYKELLLEIQRTLDEVPGGAVAA